MKNKIIHKNEDENPTELDTQVLPAGTNLFHPSPPNPNPQTSLIVTFPKMMPPSSEHNMKPLHSTLTGQMHMENLFASHLFQIFLKL